MLPYFHQTVFPAYLYTLLDRLPPEQAKTSCRFIFPENGRTRYDEGDLYTFSVILFGKNSLYIAEHLLQKLAVGIEATDNRVLHNNLQVVELIDGFSGEVIGEVNELTPWQYEDLQKQRQDLQGIEDFRLWIDSGVLFKKPLQSADELTTKRILKQLFLAALYANSDNALPLPEKTRTVTELTEQLDDERFDPADLLVDNHLFFINKTYANRDGKYKHLSGYHGRIDLHIPTDFPYRDDYLDLLLLGQYLGIGKRSNYGIGQYQLFADGKGQKYAPPPSQSLLDRLLDIRHFMHNAEYAKLADSQKQAVLAVRDAVLERRYRPSPLHFYQHTRTRLNGKKKTRTLAVAPVPERMVQKVVTKQLSQIIDGFQHRASYGYRPKRNRKQAVARIQHHIKFGNNWILESDIEDCFDHISFDVVQTRLRGLFGDDDLWRFVVDCLSAPLNHQLNRAKQANHSNQAGQLKKSRQYGIPQGSPLSPLIANLVLTDLDYDLSQQGFKHIRFADDFVVCGSSRAQVEKALVACQKSLSEHHLSLNEDKTHITQAAENFIFLGYQIGDKHVTDLSGQSPPKPQHPLEPNLIMQKGISPISHRGQTLFVCYQRRPYRVIIW